MPRLPQHEITIDKAVVNCQQGLKRAEIPIPMNADCWALGFSPAIRLFNPAAAPGL
jgi:hypothetical protein